MKRGLSLVVFVLLLTPIIALAQNRDTSGLSNLTPVGRIVPFLEKEIEIPEGLDLFARVFLGVTPEQPLTWPKLSILIACFLIFFSIFKDVMDLIPFFETKARAIAGAFIVSSLVGISGGYMLLMSFLIDLRSLFGFLTAHPILTIFLALIILLILHLLSAIIINKIKYKLKLKVAEAKGFQEEVEKSMLKRILKLWRPK